MSDFMFIIKCLAVTIAIVVLFQIRVGHRTIESHTMSWLHHSSISQHLQDVAEGAVKVTRRGERAVSTLIGGDEAPELGAQEEASTGWFKIKRSAAYERQKAKEARLAKARSENEKPLSSEERAEFDENSEND